MPLNKVLDARVEACHIRHVKLGWHAFWAHPEVEVSTGVNLTTVTVENIAPERELPHNDGVISCERIPTRLLEVQ
jgi:hypothetical protein